MTNKAVARALDELLDLICEEIESKGDDTFLKAVNLLTEISDTLRERLYRETERDSINKIADYFGKSLQTRQAIEESTEFSLACSHILRADRDMSQELGNLIEEVADLEIMLDQIKHLYDINHGLINEIKAAKIERTLHKIELFKAAASSSEVRCV